MKDNRPLVRFLFHGKPLVISIVIFIYHIQTKPITKDWQIVKPISSCISQEVVMVSPITLGVKIF